MKQIILGVLLNIVGMSHIYADVLKISVESGQEVTYPVNSNLVESTISPPIERNDAGRGYYRIDDSNYLILKFELPSSLTITDITYKAELLDESDSFELSINGEVAEENVVPSGYDEDYLEHLKHYFKPGENILIFRANKAIGITKFAIHYDNEAIEKKYLIDEGQITLNSTLPASLAKGDFLNLTWSYENLSDETLLSIQYADGQSEFRAMPGAEKIRVSHGTNGLISRGFLKWQSHEDISDLRILFLPYEEPIVCSSGLSKGEQDWINIPAYPNGSYLVKCDNQLHDVILDAECDSGFIEDQSTGLCVENIERCPSGVEKGSIDRISDDGGTYVIECRNDLTENYISVSCDDGFMEDKETSRCITRTCPSGLSKGDFRWDDIENGRRLLLCNDGYEDEIATIDCEGGYRVNSETFTCEEVIKTCSSGLRVGEDSWIDISNGRRHLICRDDLEDVVIETVCNEGFNLDENQNCISIAPRSCPSGLLPGEVDWIEISNGIQRVRCNEDYKHSVLETNCKDDFTYEKFSNSCVKKVSITCAHGQAVGDLSWFNIENGQLYVRCNNNLVEEVIDITCDDGFTTNESRNACVTELPSTCPSGLNVGDNNWRRIDHGWEKIECLPNLKEIVTSIRCDSEYIVDQENMTCIAQENKGPSATTRIQAEDFSYQEGLQVENNGTLTAVGHAVAGDYLRFDSVDFSSTFNTLTARMSNGDQRGGIEFRIGSKNGRLIASIELGNTGGWNNYENIRKSLPNFSGVHDLYVVFTDSGNLDWFVFDQIEHGSNPLRKEIQHRSYSLLDEIFMSSKWRTTYKSGIPFVRDTVLDISWNNYRGTSRNLNSGEITTINYDQIEVLGPYHVKFRTSSNELIEIFYSEDGMSNRGTYSSGVIRLQIFGERHL